MALAGDEACIQRRQHATKSTWTRPPGHGSRGKTYVEVARRTHGGWGANCSVESVPRDTKVMPVKTNGLEWSDVSEEVAFCRHDPGPIWQRQGSSFSMLGREQKAELPTAAERLIAPA